MVDIIQRPSAPFAQAIGELCIEWSHLEGWMHRLFMMIGEWDFMSPPAMDMVRCLKARDQIAAIKVGVVSRRFAPLVCEAVIGCMDYIDNTLRPARNRYVHDLFSAAEDGQSAMRIDLRPRVMTTDDGSTRFINPGQLEIISAECAREIVDDVISERCYMQGLISVTKWSPGCGHSEPLPEPPLRLLARRQQEMQRQQAQAKAKPPLPRKPSAASRRKLKDALP